MLPVARQNQQYYGFIHGLLSHNLLRKWVGFPTDWTMNNPTLPNVVWTQFICANSCSNAVYASEWGKGFGLSLMQLVLFSLASELSKSWPKQHILAWSCTSRDSANLHWLICLGKWTIGGSIGEKSGKSLRHSPHLLISTSTFVIVPLNNFVLLLLHVGNPTVSPAPTWFLK